MCWMSLYSGADGIEKALRACRENEQESGGHSWGYAVATADEELHLGHGLGTLPPFAPEMAGDGEPVAALAHTRFATRGDITLANAHPFPVENRDGEVVAALAHNGTWYDAPDDGDRCDSWYLARVLESVLTEDRPFREAVRMAGKRTGQTIAVLHRDGTGCVYSGRFGITGETDGLRSSGGTPIPTGEVRTI